MNFFEHQDQARKATGRLVILFALAVSAIIAALYLVARLALMAPTDSKAMPWTFDPSVGWWHGPTFLYVSLATLAVILLGSLYKTLWLRGGGWAVAVDLGGRPINLATKSEEERRLVNVVEEMAIASGVPVPGIYVMDGEEGINAFAAGWSPDDAAVAVTAGALKAFNRDELQGVVAHEFSHILNGDMRLNIQLMGVLHGILIISLAGYTLIRLGMPSGFSRRRKDGGGLFALGAALWLIGSMGLFFGRLIKAGVSRQREFLADASAVQFTRNPEGIAGALKKIGAFSTGSVIVSPMGEEASHFFFGKSTPGRFFSWLSTHPPLASRIRRLDPSFDEKIEEAQSASLSTAMAGVSGFTAAVSPPTLEPRRVQMIPQEVVESVGVFRPEHVAVAQAMLASIPPQIRRDAHETYGAVALVYALLLDGDAHTQERQVGILKKEINAAMVDETLRIRGQIEGMDSRVRLALVDLAAPTLRQMGDQQRVIFREVADALIHADDKVSLFEFALGKVIAHRLAHMDSARERPAAVRSLSPLLAHCQKVLSVLAQHGHLDPQEANQAYAKGMLRLSDKALGPRPMVSSIAELDQALDKLSAAVPPIKRKILDACAHCVLADGEVNADEADLLRAVAEVLDLPVPPVVPSERQVRYV